MEKNSLRSQNDAAAKELGALKAVIKVIEDYKLESEYPKETLQKRIEQLEKLKASRKRPAAASASAPTPKAQWQQPRKLQRSGNNCPRTTASVGHAPSSVTGFHITVPLFQQPHVQAAGLLPENSVAYLGSQAGPYGLVSSSPAVASYTGSSVGMYGLTGAPVGFPGAQIMPCHIHIQQNHSFLLDIITDQFLMVDMVCHLNTIQLTILSSLCSSFVFVIAQLWMPDLAMPVVRRRSLPF